MKGAYNLQISYCCRKNLQFCQLKLGVLLNMYLLRFIGNEPGTLSLCGMRRNHMATKALHVFSIKNKIQDLTSRMKKRLSQPEFHEILD